MMETDYTVTDEELEFLHQAHRASANLAANDSLRELGVIGMLRGLIDNGFSVAVAEQIVLASFIHGLRSA